MREGDTVRRAGDPHRKETIHHVEGGAMSAPHMPTQFHNVTTVPTEEDVYVGAQLVGCVFDCGDCYRVRPTDKRRTRVSRVDYDTREHAIAALTGCITLEAPIPMSVIGDDR
jgi:hypothetical protein